MLILLFVFALLRFPPATPLPATTSTFKDSWETSLLIRDASESSHFGSREVSDIVLSCLATIFACTWTAIHPNIPSPNDSGWVSFKRQVTTMLYALLAPEVVTAWAMRQYFGARRIAEEYNRKVAGGQPRKSSLTARGKFSHGLKEWFTGDTSSSIVMQTKVLPWTITHGFFLQMGGFMLRENGKPTQTLQYYNTHSRAAENIGYLIKNGSIDAPTITEAEIQDRSKGDFISKAVVVLQTTWFIAQCVARWSASLPVTELEIVTLGFAMLNAFTYGLWWNKPQSIGIPVFLDKKKITQEIGVQCLLPTASEDAISETSPNSESNDQTSKIPVEVTRASPATATNEDEDPVVLKSFFREKIEEDLKSRWQLWWRIPYRLVQVLLRPLSKLMVFTWRNVDEGDLRVPMFYSYDANDVPVFIFSSIIASLFGLIHLIPTWFLDFPSHPEMVLWKIAAFIITIQPLILGFWAKWEDGQIWDSDAKYSPLGVVALLELPFYLIARLLLLVLAFLSLRNLSSSPGALISIDWISFIPHL